MSFQCIPGAEEAYTIVLPEGYARPALQYTGAACSLEQKGSLLILAVKGEEQKADVQIYFQEEQEP